MLWFHSPPLCDDSLFRCDFGSGYFGRFGGRPGASPFLFRFGIIRSFLVLSFLSGGLGAIEALIFSSCLLVLVSLVVFVSVILFGLSHRTS